jgi:hypothetical protein
MSGKTSWYLIPNLTLLCYHIERYIEYLDIVNNAIRAQHQSKSATDLFTNSHHHRSQFIREYKLKWIITDIFIDCCYCSTAHDEQYTI